MISKKNKVWHGFIPFRIEEVQFNDRVYHISEVNNRIIKTYLWKIDSMERDSVYPSMDALFEIYTDRMQIRIAPFLWWWNIRIDRRPQYKRLLDSLLEFIR